MGHVPAAILEVKRVSISRTVRPDDLVGRHAVNIHPPKRVVSLTFLDQVPTVCRVLGGYRSALLLHTLEKPQTFPLDLPGCFRSL
jgi:hypothetical protein